MKNQIKEIILNLGADVCGVANIDRFSEAPAGFHPRNIFSDCKSVIVFGIVLPKGLTMIEPRLRCGHSIMAHAQRLIGSHQEQQKKLKGSIVAMLYRFPQTVLMNTGMQKNWKAAA
ncbi:hypothetical protein SAMN02745975_02564 [Geosporobacter subterraneus DSM 17957]|uniref:Uncharacterized protein n=1 Tax=Geosporobacter subterraneus DSM 17957 TaxID=1121919 RepID=A0A1M6L1S2_9FIRM|nr:hypothetical protein [Geosporobacter subterraneus]SHJ65118.1 hypothetical protein SAMN02745975_02564 [Geosporobacter subterraneus DSM 17957]